MSDVCIGLYMGYAVLFIMLIAMAKLYERESKKRVEYEMKYMDLMLMIEMYESKKKDA